MGTFLTHKWLIIDIDCFSTVDAEIFCSRARDEASKRGKYIKSWNEKQKTYEIIMLIANGKTI
jgi:hypothetical protein